jgi:hypothetical protein|tara:strand:+ start:2965 stop:3198 length:234 start_codon:yes stop_codon:yes gene_type:complete
MTNQKSITNFMYFGHNYPSDFISQVWGEGIANHLQSKFHSMYERKGTLAFFSWFMELDGGNQEMLTTWINKNYKAFS